MNWSIFEFADPPDGTDMLVALQYARKHNMTPELVVDEAGEWGTLYDNWTGNGVVGNLAQDMGDIGLGQNFEYITQRLSF